MSNNFYPWMSDSTANCQSSSDFSNDTQRKNGFQGGAAASSLRVNTALRQSSLVVCALMNIAAPNDQIFDVKTSAVSDVQNLLKTYFDKFVTSIDLNTTLTDYVKKDLYATSSRLGLVKSNGTFSDPNYPLLLDNNRFGYVNVTKKLYRHQISLQFNQLSTTVPSDGILSSAIMKITLTLKGVSSAITSINDLNAYLNENSINTSLVSKYIEPVQASIIRSGNSIKVLAYALVQESNSTSHHVSLFGLDGSLGDLTDMRSATLTSGNINIGDSVTEITL